MKNYIYNFVMFPIAMLSPLMHISGQAAGMVILDPHVHGLSELTMTIEKQTLEIEVTSPAINIVGFEHRAKTKKNIALVQKARIRLSRHEDLFSFSGGACILIDKSVDISSITKANNLVTDLHEHGHEHINDTEKFSHREVIGHYRYYCKKASTLTAITVKIFDQFVGINQIKARWLNETQQGSVTLSPTKQIINLR
jgi:hypothetical protein